MRKPWHLLAALQRSSWTPILGKLLVWGGAFLALAHIGGGAAARLSDAEPELPPLPSALLVEPLTAPSAALAASGPPTRASPACGESGERAVTDDGKVILNLAGVDDLVRLPGVGTKRAEAILAVREKLGGRFRRVEDLMRVRGIGPRSLRRLKPLVVLDPPESAPESDDDSKTS